MPQGALQTPRTSQTDQRQFSGTFPTYFMPTFAQKLRLLKGLSTGEKAYTGPIIVTVDLTLRCNLQCMGCLYHSPLIPRRPPDGLTPQDMPTPLFGTLCQELSLMGTRKLVLTGEGEPLLHPDLLAFISIAKQTDLHVTLFTNGTLLDENSAAGLIDSGLDRLIVSFWASSPEAYEQNSPGSEPGYFRRVLRGLESLSAMKAKEKRSCPAVILYHPVNRCNHERIAAVAEVGQATGCSGVYFVPFSSRRDRLARYALSPAEEGKLRAELIQTRNRLQSLQMTHNIDETLLRYRIGEAVWEASPCYTGWFHARIKVDGTVFPCGQCNFPVGSLHKRSFREIWNGPEYRTFRRRTMTRTGLTSVAENCDCDFCCFLKDNLRIHRVFKWFPHLAGRK